MKIKYIEKSFYKKRWDLIAIAEDIITDYSAQGFDLTLRQLYYQFVARDHIPNSQREYKKLSETISDARLAGLIDWDSIVDRTRILRKTTHWQSTKQILKATISNYTIDKWEGQPYQPEVWIEKDALIGVIAPVCEELDLTYIAVRGYNSQSEMWRAGHYRFGLADAKDQTPYILHLGDHDPSGLDMTRDIEDRLRIFSPCAVVVDRVALNIDQVQAYNPPPNFAKISDPRAKEYLAEFGTESWELDALEPPVIEGLIRDTIDNLRNDTIWQERVEEEKKGKDNLTQLIARL
jgi:hypothetical protein